MKMKVYFNAKKKKKNANTNGVPVSLKFCDPLKNVK